MPQSSAAPRDIYWTPLDDPGCEHMSVSASEQGVNALGLVLRRWGEESIRCRYELRCDADWQFREVVFALSGAGEGPPRRVVLKRDDIGNWLCNDEPAGQLAGCRDIDIEVTPFTNSLPIRRLGLGAGESAELLVAYLPVPDLVPRPARQRYTCLKPFESGAGLYRYEGLESGFAAEIPVDREGFVIDYPDIFERSWPR